MSPPRDPEALSNPEIGCAPACRKGWPHIEEGNSRDKPPPDYRQVSGKENTVTVCRGELDRLLMNDKY
jgi:hypothetical protein